MILHNCGVLKNGFESNIRRLLSKLRTLLVLFVGRELLWNLLPCFINCWKIASVVNNNSMCIIHICFLCSFSCKFKKKHSTHWNHHETTTPNLADSSCLPGQLSSYWSNYRWASWAARENRKISTQVCTWSKLSIYISLEIIILKFCHVYVNRPFSGHFASYQKIWLKKKSGMHCEQTPANSNFRHKSFVLHILDLLLISK